LTLDTLRVEREGRLHDKRNRPPCQHCGKPIPTEALATRRFCSDQCSQRGRRAAERDARPVQTCPICGTGFKATIPRQKTCGWQCGVEMRRAPPRPCDHCGTIIDRPMRDQRFCTPHCRVNAYKARVKAKRR
jgi:predicted nucleic acid-binding Zn ribbon protein